MPRIWSTNSAIWGRSRIACSTCSRWSLVAASSSVVSTSTPASRPRVWTRARAAGQVGGHPGPQPDGRDAGPVQPLLQHRLDAGRQLHDHRHRLQPGRQVGVGRGAHDRHRVGVQGRGREGAEPEHLHHFEAPAGLDDLVAEGPPAEVGLGPDEHERVPVAARGGHQQLGGRPGHLLDGAAGQPDDRPPGPEVDQLVGVEGGQGGRVPARAQEHGSRLAGQPGVSPAVEVDDQERVAELRRVGEVEQLAHARQGSRFRPGTATVRRACGSLAG
jgi:hypothetical protein